MKKRDVMLTTAAHRPAFDDFADAMREAERAEGWRSSEALRHFLEAGYRALRGRVLIGEAFDANEAEYMKIVGRCRDAKTTMSALATMLGTVGLALRADPVDFIGPVFSELSADAGMGQFFTPHALSYLNAKMILDDAPAMLADRPYITLQEPACGVGGMILAANVVLREAGLDVARQAHWHATDVDFRAMAGCYIQCAMTDVSGVIFHGNTLSLECWARTPTPAAIFYPKRFSTGDDPAPIPPPATLPPEQLSLF